MKVLGPCEVLADQFRANQSPSRSDQTSVRLVRKKDLANAGDRKRVYNAEQKRQKKFDTKRG